MAGPEQNQIELPQLHGPMSVELTDGFAGSGPLTLSPSHPLTLPNVGAVKKAKAVRDTNKQKMRKFWEEKKRKTKNEKHL